MSTEQINDPQLSATALARKMASEAVTSYFSADQGIGRATVPTPAYVQDGRQSPVYNQQPALVSPVVAQGATGIPAQQDTARPDDTQIDQGIDTRPAAQTKQEYAFAELRHQLKEAQAMVKEKDKTVKDLSDQLASFKTKAEEADTKNQELVKQLSGYEERLGQLDLENSPEFKAKFDAPVDHILTRLANTIVENTDTKDQQVAVDLATRLLSATGPEIMQSISKLPPMVQGSIMNYVKDAQDALAKRSEALTQWRATQAGIDELSARKRASEATERRNSAVEAALSSLRESQSIPYMQVSDPSFIKERDGIIETAANALKTASEADLISAALEGFSAKAAYRMIESLYAQLQDANNKLRATLDLSYPHARAYSGDGQPSAKANPAPTGGVDQLRPGTTHDLAVDFARQAVKSWGR